MSSKAMKPYVFGRPPKYNPSMVKKGYLYLVKCVDEIEEFHKTRGEKSDSYDRLVRVKIPTIEGLALSINVNRDTIQEWEKIYPDFSVMVKKLREKQAQALIEGGLSGDYNPMIAKLLLNKHGYRDAQEIMGKDGRELFTGLTDEDRAKLDNLLLE